MKVLNILPNTNLAGTEQVSLRFMTGMQPSGYTFQVLSLNPAGQMKDIFELNNIRTFDMSYKGKGGWKSYLALKRNIDRIITDYKPDIIVQTSHNILATIAISGYNIPKILSIHFHHEGVKPVWQWKLIYRYCYSRFTFITFPSEYIMKEAKCFVVDTLHKLRVIRNPLPPKEHVTKEMKSAAKEKIGIPAEAMVIGNSSQLIIRKRLDVFLEVAKRIVEQDENVFFLIAGDGDDADVFKEKAKSLGIDDKIQWLGWQKDLSVFYQALDFMLFNSDWDAFPTTPLEAMAYGVPVVASAVNSGLKEVINNNQSGLLLKDHDIEQMASYILAVRNGQLPNTGIKGRKRVMEICDYKRCVADYEALFSTLK